MFGSDHGGFELKEQLKQHLKALKAKGETVRTPLCRCGWHCRTGLDA